MGIIYESNAFRFSCRSEGSFQALNVFFHKQIELTDVADENWLIDVASNIEAPRCNDGFSAGFSIRSPFAAGKSA